MHMGKKPVLGLVGLAWLGLTVGGCKHCDCDKTAQDRQQRRDNGYAKAWRQPKPQDATAQQTQVQAQEGAVASKGTDPRLRPAYDLDDTKYEPTAKGSVARQIQEVPQQLPEKLTAESAAVMKKPAGNPELVQTGRATETPGAPELPRSDVVEHKSAITEGTVPAHAAPGPDLGEVRPPAPAQVGETPVGGPGNISAPPTVEKVGGSVPVPPPPPAGAAPGMAPEPIRELAPAAPLPAPSQPLSAAPAAPPAEASKVVDPASGATPPAPASPVVEVPPPPSAMQNGVKEGLMPPLPAAPASTPQLPSVQSPYSPNR
jgi:hypothetical protein